MGVDLYLETRGAIDMIEKDHVDPLTGKPYYGTFHEWESTVVNGTDNLSRSLGFISQTEAAALERENERRWNEEYPDVDTYFKKNGLNL